MTMLDRMRRHRNWLKWILGLIVLAFVVFYIPDFLGLRGRGGVAASHRDRIADVDGRTITVGEFRRVYNAQLQSYRGQFGGKMNEQLLKQLGIDRQILQQLIDERAALAEAERLGLSAGDAEVRERIVAFPAFQENGQFIGADRYTQFLRMQNPPVSTTEFEESIRRSIVLDKLRSALTDWISVSDTEVDQEYRRRNEKVKLAVVAFPADKFREGITATDQELGAYFEKHKDDFKIGERRKIRYLAIDTQKLRERVVPTAQDVERAYNTNFEQYATPEQVRASHVLLKTDGKDDAAVRAQAEKIAADARGGADFAELAKKYSEDEGSKANGGDLGLFGRGRMVPEFERAAFTLAPGSISDPVKSQFGYHVIKVVEKQEQKVRPIDEVRAQIVEQVKFERAQEQASTLADKLAGEVKSAGALDKAAAANGLQVQESGFFVRDEPIAGIGPSPEVSAEAFTLKQGDVSGALRTPQGFAFITVTGTEPARTPTLDEVKDRVREAAIKEKAAAAAGQRANELAATLRAAADFEAAAKAAGLEAKTTELIARGGSLPDVGVSPQVDAAAFTMPIGQVSGAIATDNGTVVFKVIEKTDVTPEQLAAGRAATRTEMLNERRGRFFSSYMTKAKEKMRITIDREMLARTLA